ncbi:MAG: cytidylate kinase [Syntrophorhabdus sp. PtaU1.Bin002]|nr:MAG: cytidylate kinase [Syntrophorhabdus sp. PtaU1.Bin002]
MAILTISRQHGSTGKEIGQKIAQELGFEYIDRERVLKDLKEAGQDWEKLVKEFEEHDPSLWERYDWGFKGFIALLHSMILKYVLKDKMVILGRGVNFLLKDVPYVLKIRFEAPLEKRIEYIVERENIDYNTAKWFIQKLDRESAGYVKAVFHKAWDDPKAYDMVINTAAQSNGVIINSIKEALADKERFNTEENRREMALWSVAADIRASIMTNPKIQTPTLHIEPVGSTIILRGLTHNPTEHNMIEAEARRIAGTIPVKCELRYR